MHPFRSHRLAVVLALATLEVACAPQRPVAKLSGRQELAAPVATPEPARDAPATLSELEEDERGIVGAPQDDTAFAFDALFAEAAEPPQITGGEPVPASIRRSLAPFLESRRARLASMTPDGKRMLVAGICEKQTAAARPPDS